MLSSAIQAHLSGEQVPNFGAQNTKDLNDLNQKGLTESGSVANIFVVSGTCTTENASEVNKLLNFYSVWLQYTSDFCVIFCLDVKKEAPSVWGCKDYKRESQTPPNPKRTTKGGEMRNEKEDVPTQFLLDR